MMMMRSGAIIIVVALAACYDEPTSAPACAITCDDTCPGDLSCVHGYCVGKDQTCEPTLRATGPPRQE